MKVGNHLALFLKSNAVISTRLMDMGVGNQFLNWCSADSAFSADREGAFGSSSYSADSA